MVNASSRPRLGAPPGAIRTLSVRWEGQGRPEEGDFFDTGGGSLYFVEAVRHTRGPNYRVDVIKLDPSNVDVEPDWRLEWDRRR